MLLKEKLEKFKLQEMRKQSQRKENTHKLSGGSGQSHLLQAHLTRESFCFHRENYSGKYLFHLLPKMFLS